MRNPFRRQDENVRPASADVVYPTGNGIVPLDLKQPAEYQLSEINDSGVYVPPTPPDERKSFWSTTSSSRSTTSSSLHRNAFNENEHFNISRESFDSYRRSFDISARSPVITPIEQRSGRFSLDSRSPFERPPLRISLDSRPLHPPPSRTSNSFQRPSQVPAETREEVDTFEDVDIAEPKPQAPKKRGIFSRIVDSGDNDKANSGNTDGAKGVSWHHFGGRKRGQSGQGSELGSIPQRETTPKPFDYPPKRDSRLEELLSAEQPSHTAGYTRRAPPVQAEVVVPTEEIRETPMTTSQPVPPEAVPTTQPVEKPQAPEVKSES